MIPPSRQSHPWPSSPALDSIRVRAEALLAQAAALPDRITVSRLARFFDFSKTPIQSWIRWNLVTAKRSGQRRLILKAEVYRIIEAASTAAPYETKRPKPFHKLRRRRKKVNLPAGRSFTIKEVTFLFNCSRTTVMRAELFGHLKIKRLTNYRWIVSRRDLLESPVFGRLILQKPKAGFPRSIRLPSQPFFTTGQAACFCDVSQQTVRNLIRARQLAGVRLGARKLNVPRESLRSFLKERPAAKKEA